MKKQLRNLPVTEMSSGDSGSGQGKQEGRADDRTRTGGPALTPPATTCIEHAYGAPFRLSFQIKVF